LCWRKKGGKFFSEKIFLSQIINKKGNVDLPSTQEKLEENVWGAIRLVNLKKEEEGIGLFRFISNRGRVFPNK